MMRGRTLKSIRAQTGMSQRDLAELLCVSCPAVCRMERNKLAISKRTARMAVLVLLAINAGFEFAGRDLGSEKTFADMVKAAGRRA